jgi:hypothetical protein
MIALLFPRGLCRDTGPEPMVEDPDLSLDSPLTRELFLEWRSPRRGSANPELMSNPVWDWLVRSELDAYRANSRFDGPAALGAGPGWCFTRFGQSSTKLSDGRIVLVAGEHEDHYDPDFYIYNDVVVRHPDGRIDIFGYPTEVFPATDFHSATLVGDRVILIGNLGYPEDRKPEMTPVFVLELATFSISALPTCGTPPGWIHEHEARLSVDGASIVIQRGLLDRGDPSTSLVENIDDWRLWLADFRWERLTDRRWPRWEVRRSDRRSHHLFEYQTALWARQHPHIPAFSQSTGTTLDDELGRAPDLELFERLYRPALSHEALPDLEDQYGVHRIRVEGVVVRYVERMCSIQMTVEGELPSEVADRLGKDLFAKFAALENADCEIVRL